MSEPIQSISQGNYILQGTVATSAGIVGDGSTQNPLRADETVLWSGTMTWGQNGSLTDSVKNYERIRFYIEETNRHRKSTNEMVLTDLSNANLRGFSLNLPDATTEYFGNYFTVYQINEAGTSISSISGRQWWYNPWTSTAINGSVDRGLILKKVVGINRINNA